MSLSRLVKATGCESRIAIDGERAIQLAETFQPHIILLDISMPGMDGFEICRRIRGQDFGRQTAIVAVSGWDRAEDRQKTRETGFNDYVVKPVSIACLKRIMTLPQQANSPEPDPHGNHDH
jgi:CheY-like chemotaxis protein